MVAVNLNLELYFGLLRELELRVRYLLEQKWRDSQDIWREQNELISFQLKLQESLTGERAVAQTLKEELAEAARSKADGWKARCQELQEQLKFREERIASRQQALLVSRRLGDAWAWLLFQFNEQAIEPLTQNRPVGRTSSDHAILGVQTIAEALSNAGAGFPVIHDMTDCLRVGDISFVNRGRLPLTIEVKSHKEGEQDGRISLQVETHLIGGSEDMDHWREISLRIPFQEPQTESAGELVPQTKSRRIPRLPRQLKRMRIARAWQAAIPGAPIEFGEGPNGLLIQAVGSKSAYHWEIVRDLATKARKEGFASQAVDNAFVYMAIYSETPLLAIDDPNKLPQSSQIGDSISSSGILFQNPLHNRLTVTTSFEYISDHAPLNVLPFFWYPLSPDLVVDMMFGRLFFVVAINLWRVVEALRQVGLDADLPNSEVDYWRDFISVSRQIARDDGSSFKVESHGLAYYARKLSFEFLSLPVFAETVKSMMDVVVEQAEEKFRQVTDETATTEDMS